MTAREQGFWVGKQGRETPASQRAICSLHSTGWGPALRLEGQVTGPFPQVGRSKGQRGENQLLCCSAEENAPRAGLLFWRWGGGDTDSLLPALTGLCWATGGRCQ